MKQRCRAMLRVALSIAAVLGGSIGNEAGRTFAVSAPEPLSAEPNGCLPTVTINSVNELTFQPPNDRFEIAWTHSPPSPCFVLEGGATMSVKITRLGGHVDQTVQNISPNDGVVVVSIPRASFERPAATVFVDVSLSLIPNAQVGTRAEGPGPPATSSITSQTPFSISSRGGTPVSPACKPAIKITQLNFNPGSSGLKDLVEILWDARNPESNCVSLSSFKVATRVTRVTNSSGATQDFFDGAFLDAKSRGARVELDGKGEIKSFSIEVSAVAGRSLTATAHLEKSLRFKGTV
jgi:hypothetical protein